MAKPKRKPAAPDGTTGAGGRKPRRGNPPGRATGNADARLETFEQDAAREGEDQRSRDSNPDGPLPRVDRSTPDR
jgi:hypothetical protein